MKKTIFIAIAFGTSVRDVLRNDTYKMLLNDNNIRVVVFAQEISEEFVSEFGHLNQVSFEQINPFKATFVERFLLHFHRSTLRNRCRTIDLGNTSGDTKVLDFFMPFANLAHRIFGIERTNNLIYFLYQIFAKRKDYFAVFAKYKPNLVIVTRVLNYSSDYPVMRTANFLNVPVIALVSSWDNLTSKAFFPFSLRHLVVWNNILKDEAISLFNFPHEKISVTGIPRYDLFFRKFNFKSKSDFFRKWNIKSKNKIITYCTGSETTGKSILDPISPESGIVKYIAKECEKKIFGDVTFIVRLHPQANINHYLGLNSMNNVILNIPGKKGRFQDRLFSENEDIEFGELMLYSDVVINFASTVTIDAAVFDTPIVCVNFDFNGERPYEISPKRIYEFDHYAKLLKMEGVSLSNSRKEMINDIKKYLLNPNLHKEGRKRIVQQQCVYTDGRAGERVYNSIISAI